MHVALRAETGQPIQMLETVGSHHNGPLCEKLTDPSSIMVMDRTYGKLSESTDLSKAVNPMSFGSGECSSEETSNLAPSDCTELSISA